MINESVYSKFTYLKLKLYSILIQFRSHPGEYLFLEALERPLTKYGKTLPKIKDFRDREKNNTGE